MNSSPTQVQRWHSGDKSTLFAYLLVASVFLVQFWRLLSLTLARAVNILYWDQWDYYQAFFEPHSLWQVFDWQHGPHRQGLGFVFAGFLDQLTHWNSRAAALAIVGVLACATLLALYLKNRLFGHLSVSDAVIPLFFLTRAQYEMLVGATNLSHGPFPLLLVVLICLAWLQRNQTLRYGLIVVLNFLTIFTGFGIFMGCVTPAMLVLDARGCARKQNKRGVFLSLTALALSLASLGVFFIDYKFQPAVDCFKFPYGDLSVYPWYAGLMWANGLGMKGFAAAISTVGVCLFIISVGAALHNLTLIWQGRTTIQSPNAVISILLSYSLLFTINTAIGRVCLGMETADASRYIPYVSLGLIGLYFQILMLRRLSAQRILLTGFVISAALAGLHLTPKEKTSIDWYSNGKQAWKECYLKLEDVAQCDARTGFQVLPDTARLQERLAFLKRNKLNLYAEIQ